MRVVRCLAAPQVSLALYDRHFKKGVNWYKLWQPLKAAKVRPDYGL
jgi:hypothetical protein